MGIGRRGWLLLATTASLSSSACNVAPRESRAEGSSEPIGANRGCASCHTEIAQEWRGSLHRQSATNRAFASAFGSEPDPFCWGCHAPEAAAQNGVVSPAAQLGVACTTCHLDQHGAVMTAKSGHATNGSHAVLPTERLSGSQACASCHEFAFPGPGRTERAMMQTTVSEHARSPFSAQACSDCHMPRVGRDQHRSHAFASTRDPAALRRAVLVAAQRSGGELKVSIAPRGVGHAFPTGDLFRRLRVVVEAVTGERVLRREQRYLARHFLHRPQADGVSRREEASDDRPGARSENAGAVEVVVHFEPPFASSRLRWQVVYERVDHLLGDSEDAATVGEAVVLASGEMEP